jgi:hypothetical protein
MTWIGEVELGSVATLTEAPVELDLLIVGTDGLTPADLDRLAGYRRSTPVVVVGNAVVAAERSFGPKLTSRELKQAIRELVFARPAVALQRA